MNADDPARAAHLLEVWHTACHYALAHALALLAVAALTQHLGGRALNAASWRLSTLKTPITWPCSRSGTARHDCASSMPAM